jgi:hypothetical protein
MPRSVDLFIESQDPLETLAEFVAGIEGVVVTPVEEGRCLVQDGEVRAVLGAHRLAGEGELALGRYRYAASAEVPDTVRPHDSAQAVLLRKVAQRLQEKSSATVLMVLDLQYRGKLDQPEVHA